MEEPKHVPNVKEAVEQKVDDILKRKATDSNIVQARSDPFLLPAASI